MYETIQEFCDSRGVGMRIDREAGVIRGVKILGSRSRNGRTYTSEAMRSAVPLYEGAKVNVNHAKGSPQSPRDYQDRIGTVRDVVFREGDGLFGDLHFNPAHALAGQLIWDAEHAPENVGFSHNVQGRTSQRGDALVVEAIMKVQSVDLVADPATTRGLFEAAVPAAEPPALAAATLADLERFRVDLVEAVRQPLINELDSAKAENQRLIEAAGRTERRALSRRLLAEFKLPDPDSTDPWDRAVVSPTFFESLLAAVDEGQMRRLVEDRARLVQSARGGRRTQPPGQPVSRDQRLAESFLKPTHIDVREFVRSITS